MDCAILHPDFLLIQTLKLEVNEGTTYIEDEELPLLPTVNSIRILFVTIIF